MKNGRARFDFHLNQLEKLLLEAANQENPALWLYQHNARTPLFMLEGLARLYGGLHNQKKFGKIGKQCKTLEDAIGALDYYAAFAKDFSQDKKVPVGVTAFVQTKSVATTKLLNDLLIKQHWLGAKANRISKIRKQLGGADWLEAKAEMKAIESFYRITIEKINAFAKNYQAEFTDLETQVHELRRKLRWLSIYPQALQGCIQLTEESSQDENVAKYLTPEIVNSPFNKMPDAGANAYLLTLNRDYFFALSWLIAELGKLKDAGLRLVVLREAGRVSKADAKAKTAILSQATDICRSFFAEKNLDKLLHGISKGKIKPV